MLRKYKKNKYFYRVVYLALLIMLIAQIILSGCMQNLRDKISEEITAGSQAETFDSGKSEVKSTTGQDDTTDSIPETAAKAGQEEIISAFNAQVEKNSMPDELIKYIDLNLGNADTKTMAIFLEKLEYSQKTYQEIAMQYLFEGDGQKKLQDTFGSEEEFILENIDRLPDDVFKNDIIKMFEGGYKFVNLEGAYYPIIDFEYLKKYSHFLDEEYNDYLDIRAIESNWVYSRDAGLTISWDELAERMINAEKYIVTYPSETPRKIEAGRLLLGYFAAYIYGQDNTPTRDWQTSAVYDEVIKSYENTIARYPQSAAVKILSDYLAELKKNDYILSDTLLINLDKYLNRLIKEYLLDSYYMISEQIKNISYQSEHAAFGYIKLSEGKYFENYDSGTGLLITLSDFYDVGDLNDDGINDGAAIIIEEPGNGSVFYYLHAVYNSGSYIYNIAHSFLGDRVKIRDLRIEEGIIFIEMTGHSQDDPKGYPTLDITKVFQLDGYDLAEL